MDLSATSVTSAVESLKTSTKEITEVTQSFAAEFSRSPYPFKRAIINSL